LPGGAAEVVVERNIKYTQLFLTYTFIPIAMDGTLQGAINNAGL